MKILRLTDLVLIEYSNLKIKVSTLTASQRSEVASAITVFGGVERIDNQKSAMLTIKHSVKEIEGLENFDGTPYVLSFDDSLKTSLTENCAVELLNLFSSLPVYDAINMATVGMINSKIKGVSMKVLNEKK